MSTAEDVKGGRAEDLARSGTREEACLSREGLPREGLLDDPALAAVRAVLARFCGVGEPPAATAGGRPLPEPRPR